MKNFVVGFLLLAIGTAVGFYICFNKANETIKKYKYSELFTVHDSSSLTGTNGYFGLTLSKPGDDFFPDKSRFYFSFFFEDETSRNEAVGKTVLYFNSRGYKASTRINTDQSITVDCDSIPYNHLDFIVR